MYTTFFSTRIVRSELIAFATRADSSPTRRLYFSRVNCSNTSNWNIYRVAADG